MNKSFWSVSNICQNFQKAVPRSGFLAPYSAVALVFAFADFLVYILSSRTQNIFNNSEKASWLLFQHQTFQTFKIGSNLEILPLQINICLSNPAQINASENCVLFDANSENCDCKVPDSNRGPPDYPAWSDDSNRGREIVRKQPHPYFIKSAKKVGRAQRQWNWVTQDLPW